MFQLNPHQFASVFESLKRAGTKDGSDKRHSTRMDVQAKIKLALISDGKLTHSFSGLTRDISTCGVGLFQHVPIQPDGKFLVFFPDEKHQLIVTCVARFCRTLADGLFGVGAEFVSLADPQLAKQFQDVGEESADRIRQSILG